MSRPVPVQIEIAVDSVESALAAARGGAHRLELAAALELGGLTPSPGFVAAVRAQVALPLYVLLRPRAGDFLYSAAELDIMRRDLETARQAGAAGIVIGFLTPAGSVDGKRTREFVRRARPLAVTFHRAFDLAADPAAGLQALLACGVDNLLTSGGSQSAAAGWESIAALAQAARGRIELLAGGGVTAANARSLVERAGVRWLHAGLRSPLPSRMRYRNENIALGALSGREYLRHVVREEPVRALLAAVAQT